MAVTIIEENGRITISDDIIAMIAGYAVVENYGVVGMASKKATDGIVELLGRENLKRGVLVSTMEDSVVIDVHIIVEYGVSLVAVADNVRQNVAYKIKELTGTHVEAVNVHVEGVRVSTVPD